MAGYIEKLRSMTPEERSKEIDEIASKIIHSIEDDQAFCDCIASTNALGWDVDDYECDAAKIKFNGGEARIPVTYSASGEQDEERGFCGDSVSGRAVLVIDDNGHASFDEVHAQVDDY